jgi:hypothetical protein
MKCRKAGFEFAILSTGIRSRPETAFAGQTARRRFRILTPAMAGLSRRRVLSAALIARV